MDAGVKGFAGKAALITGAPWGWGRAYALHLVDPGADIVINDTNLSACEELAIPPRRGCRYEDVADLVVFLLSDRSSYMTGQAVNLSDARSFTSRLTQRRRSGLVGVGGRPRW